MNLVERIKNDRTTAMKQGNKNVLSVLRLLLAELDKERVSLKLAEVSELSNEQVQTVISRQIKKLDKEIEAYEAVGRETRVQHVEKELLKIYLPQQATEDEIRELAHQADSLVRNRKINNAMQFLSQKLRGRADMKLVAKIAKEVQKENENASN